MKKPARFLRHPFAVLGVLLSAVLAVGGVSAESRAPASGFLYSEHLAGVALPEESAAIAGSFVVQTSRPLTGFRAKTGDFSVRREVQDYVIQNADLSSSWQAQAQKVGMEISEIVARESFLQAAEGLDWSGFVRTAEFDWQSELGGRSANAGASFLGAFQEEEGEAAAWQFRGFKVFSGRVGSNLGLVYRRMVGETMVGVNAFWDYESKDVGSFWRGSLGTEVRSAWVDFYGNYYSGITDEARRGTTVFYTADGYDLEANVHSPKVRWFTAAAAYYNFKGEFGDSNDSGVRFGAKVHPPNSGMEFELYRDSGKVGNNFGGKLSWTRRFGAGNSAPSSTAEFRLQDYFFVPVEREYTQRVRVTE